VADVVPTRELRTNRDLYLFVAAIGTNPAAGARTLEHYLAMVWLLATEHRELDAVSLTTFAALLEGALHGEPPDHRRVLAHRHSNAPPTGYDRWEHTLLEQIVDLHQMQQSGSLADPMRYFGIDSPRGARWYNFTPTSYLECGVAGTFDGWQDGDPTGRSYVPGHVAVIDDAGHITAVDPRAIDQPTSELATVSWDQLADFLVAGQSYE
jgi:hypothetical protein